MTSLSSYKISTLDGNNFNIDFSGSNITIFLEENDKLYDYEEKCSKAIKNKFLRTDENVVIELAADLWIQKIRFKNKK